MTTLRSWLGRLRHLLRSSRADHELTRELNAHLALLEDDLRRRGLSPGDAARAARRHFGGIDQTRELQRDARSIAWLEDLRRDVPYAWRGLRRTPAFTLAAVLTIALGIGATTTIFAVVNAILLRPLPYANSDRLVQIAENVATPTATGVRHSRRFAMTQQEFLEWRRRTTTLSRMAGVANLMNNSIVTDEGRIAAPRAIVSPALFEMLGVPAQLGRTLIAEDERADADAVVISDSAWQRFFGRDPGVLGRKVTLLNAIFTVVGVMPPAFEFPERAIQFWTAQAPRPGDGRNAFGNAVALLADGVSLAAAIDEANALGSALRPPPPTAAVGYGTPAAPPPPPATAIMGGAPVDAADRAARPRFDVLPVKDLVIAPIRPSIGLLGASVVVLLLIVCANLANLMLARGTARQREIGLRLAIGAGRGRIVRQVLTESAVLSLLGSVLGAAFAAAGVQVVKALATIDTPRLFQLSINLGDGSLLPRISELRVDGSLLLFAMAASLLASVIFGLVPAADMARTNYARTISTGAARQDQAAPARQRMRNILVVTQVGLATALLVAAGLLGHTFVKLVTVDPGYDITNVLMFQLGQPSQATGEQRVAAIERVIARLEADPRVTAAGYTNIAPFLSLTEYSGLFVPPGRTRETMLEDPDRPQTRIVSHGFLPALGARLLQGRWFSERDGGAQPKVLIVNRALAQRYFGAESPVGAMVQISRTADYAEQWEIIGVVDDLLQARLDQPPYPIVYADLRQVVAARAALPRSVPQIGGALPGFDNIFVRSAQWPALASEVRGLVRGLDPALSADSIAPLEQLHAGSLVRPRFYATLVGLFAAIAAVLAAIGVYGVLAYAVVQRTHEIGVRMALGARRRALLRAVLARGLMLTATGIAAGLTAAVASSRSLGSMLYGLTPADPVTYALVALGFALVAAPACYLPAARATRVDPAVALRAE
jgi:predicted permease